MPAGDSTAWTPNAHGLTAKSAAKSSGQHLFPIGLARGEFLPVDFARQPEIAVTFSGLSPDATIRATWGSASMSCGLSITGAFPGNSIQTNMKAFLTCIHQV
jgi:hypothetical protein